MLRSAKMGRWLSEEDLARWNREVEEWHNYGRAPVGLDFYEVFQHLKREVEMLWEKSKEK
jgi:hypothetical protein